MSFKIVFHVMRQNWYRIFSAPIAEALRRGWEVECWHATYSEKILGANSPDINRVPEFAGKQPRIILYQGACELGELIDITSAHAIIDCDISLVPKLCKERERPVTILLDGLSHPILSRLKSGSVKTLPAYDVFALPSKQHMSDIIRCQSEGREEMIKVMHREKIYNIKYLHNFLHSWTALEKKYFINHSVVVGTPSLDDIKLIDPIEVKHRLGIPHDHPLVGVLPSPWDMPMELFCGEFNMSKTICGVIKSILKYKEYNLPLSKIFLPRDKNIMASIMKFCKYNNAFLLTKLRHSRSPSKIIKKVADKCIGEDRYYPHSALEFFSVADVVFGFTSSAVYECIAVGVPYVDIELPFFPKSFYTRHICPSLSGTHNWPGVVWAKSAEEIVKNIPTIKIKEFSIDETERDAFLKKYTAFYDDGLSSARFLNFIEEQARVKDTFNRSV